MNRRLYRSQTESVLGGVAGGVAEYLDARPRHRSGDLGLAGPAHGRGLLHPVRRDVDRGAVWARAGGGCSGTACRSGHRASTGWNAQPRRAARRSGSGSWIFGLILIGLGLYFLAREYLPGLDFDRLWPLGLVLLGVILLFGAIRSRPA